MTVKQQEKDINDLIIKMENLGDTVLKIIGLTEISILKIGSFYGDLSNLALIFSGEGAFAGNTKKSFTNIMNVVSTTASKVKLLTKEMNLASLATKTFKVALPVLGVAMASMGLLSVISMIDDLCKKESEAIKKTRDHTQEIKNQKAEWDKLLGSSKQNFESSLQNITLARIFQEELVTITENSDLIAENHGRINYLVDRLNTLLPDVGLHFNELTGEIVNMNGETVNLSESIDKLIEKRQAQSFLNFYQDPYDEAIVNIDDLRDSLDKTEKDIKEKEATMKKFFDFVHDSTIKYGDNPKKLNEILQEYEKQTGLSYDSIREMRNEIALLNEGYEADLQKLREYEKIIETYEGIQKGMALDDYDQVYAHIKGLGEIKLFEEGNLEQIPELIDQYSKLGELVTDLNDKMKNGEKIDQRLLNIATKQYEAAKEQLSLAEEAYGEELINQYYEKGLVSGEGYNKGIMEKQKELGVEMVGKGFELGSNIIKGINQSIQSESILPVYMDVVCRYHNVDGKLQGLLMGASYDDSIDEGSQFTPFSSGTSGFMAQARETIRSVQSRIARNIVSIPVIENRVLASEGKKVEVQQNNVFNVPVQKPSDVTRAIERMNRELARKL